MNDFTPPSYRQFYVIFKNESLKKDFNYFLKVEGDLETMLAFKRNVYEFLGKEISASQFQLSQQQATNRQLLSDLRQKGQENQDLKNQIQKINEHIEENKTLHQQIQQIQAQIQNLEAVLNSIKSAKFFKLWQAYCRVRKIIFSK